MLEPECEVALGVATIHQAMHVTLVREGRAVALVHVRRERVVQREMEVRYDLHAAQPQDGADERYQGATSSHVRGPGQSRTTERHASVHAHTIAIATNAPDHVHTTERRVNILRTP